MSYLTQMVGLAVQNFASAAVGMAVAVALVRGFVRSESHGIGNFWADLVRGTLYVLIPLALVVGVVLLARGVVQTFDGPAHVQTLGGGEQTIAAAARAVRGPGGDQGARHERRRLVQRQLGASLREPDAVHEPARDLESAADPVRDAVPVRAHARADARGHRDPRGDAAPARHGLRHLARRGDAHDAGPDGGGPHARAQHGRQGAALHGAGGRDLQRLHDRHVDRRGQLDARLLHGDRRRRADDADPARRGRPRRCRHRSLLDPAVRHADGLHRGPDGRAHTGVPGQVDRRPRGQARDARRARDAGRLPRHRRPLVGARTTASPARSTPGRTASARSSTRSPRPGTTTARPSPA